jgi:hypothetical protein
MSNTFANITSIDLSALITEAAAYIQKHFIGSNITITNKQFVGKAIDIAAANVIPSIVSTFANTSIRPLGVSVMVINTTNSYTSLFIPDNHPWPNYRNAQSYADVYSRPKGIEYHSVAFPWPHDQIYLPIINCEGVSFDIFNKGPNWANTKPKRTSVDQPIIVAASTVAIPIALPDESSSYVLQIIAPGDNSALFS